MIAHLNGIVAGVGLDGAVIEVGGVGLRVQCTPDTLATLKPGQQLQVKATAPSGETKTFTVQSRVDTANEVEYLRHGGILPYVLRQALGK